MPTVEQQPWSQELQQQLSEIRERYTTDRYPLDIETQHDYDTALHLLETNHFSRLHDIDRAERDQFDSDVRTESASLNDGAADPGADRTYRQTDDYRERLTELVDGQADRIAWSSRSFGKTYADLDERFGFPDRGLYFDYVTPTEPTQTGELTPPQAPTEQQQALAAWERSRQPIPRQSEPESGYVASRNRDSDGPDL